MLYGRNFVPCGSQIGGCLHIQPPLPKLIVLGIVPSRGSSERPAYVKTDDLGYRMGSIAGPMPACATRYGSSDISVTRPFVVARGRRHNWAAVAVHRARNSRANEIGHRG